MKTILRLASMLGFLTLTLGLASQDGGAGCATTGPGSGGGFVGIGQMNSRPAPRPTAVPDPDDSAGPTYVIQSGDSLSRIAAMFGVATRDLIAANNIVDARQVKVGQRLVIPLGSDSSPPSSRRSMGETARKTGSAPGAYVPQQIDLPARSWTPENIAVADLNAFTLSPGEAKTLTEKMHTTLVQTGYFNILSRSEMQTVLEAQKFLRTDSCDDSECLVEMGKILAVQKIVGGSIGQIGRTYNLTLRLVNVETGQTELTTDRMLKDEPDRLLDLMVEAARELAWHYARARPQP